MAEDDDIEQDSEAYRKWRSGNDNDKYASSKTPTESGSKSGSYSIPKADDEYALPGEDDNTGGGGDSWLDGDMNWPVLIGVFIAFVLVIAAVFGAVMSSTESDSKPSEWPETEGIIIKHYDTETFITKEYCEDDNDDGYLDDWECWKDFVYQIGLVYNYTIDGTNYTLNENTEFFKSEWVDDIEQYGEDNLFQKFVNETEQRIALNSTVIITYNPEKYEDAYSPFMGVPDDPLGFVGWFLMCCGGLFCIPIIIVGIVLSWAQRATGMSGGYGRNRWGPFGGFGNNRHRSNRGNRGATRRSGGTSRSGGGGRSGSGSRGGGSRSGGGGRRR